MAKVLIVGAGPTGLALATELMARGISIRIIDENEAPSTTSKALGIQARTLEHFHQMGIAKEPIADGIQVESINIHRQTDSFTIPLAIDSLFNFILIYPQSKTEALLIKRLEFFGQSVERGTRFDGFTNKTAHLIHTNGASEDYEFDWLIGCDGAHSAVRHALNLPFQGHEIGQNFVIADITAKTPLTHDEAFAFLSHQGPLLILPLPYERGYRLIASLPLDFSIPEDVMTFFQNIVTDRMVVPLTIESIQWNSQFSTHRRMTRSMRVGHVFLAGDASHIHSPAGGQGLNTSIQDAFNLAWKLAFVIQKKCPEALLDTYSKERRLIAKKVLFETTQVMRFLKISQGKLGGLLFKFLKILTSSEKIQRLLSKKLSETAVMYPKSSFFYESREHISSKTLKVGQRCPLLFPYNELCQDHRFIIFIFGTNKYEDLIASIEKNDADTIQCVLVEHEVKTEAIFHAFGAKEGTIVVIRPDGYIAYRQKKGQPLQLKLFLDHLFNRDNDNDDDDNS
ncbi:MAG: FAD-dependent monooxygenase [Parachlamydiales bacterium]|nr:FAD-dependent monooxygenase [Parachlamydiales bacterium]